MNAITKKISWSNSTVSYLRQCSRKFYFAHEMANFRRTDKLKRKAFELKQMQNIQMWQGSVVDKIIETHIIPKIETKCDIDFNDIAEIAVDLAKRRFKFSENQTYTDNNISKTNAGEEFCILDIHEIGTKYNVSEIDAAYIVIKNSILNFPKIRLPLSEVFLIDYLKAANKLLPNITNWHVSIELADVKPQIDLILYDTNWKPAVIDWKVSDSWVSDYSKQLIIIGLVLYLKRLEKKDKYPYSYEEIKLYEVNLLKGQIKGHELSEDIAADMIDYINLTSSDIQLIKKDILENHLGIDSFDTTTNQSTCKFCNFRTLCSYLIINKFQYDENTYLKSVQVQQFA